MTIEGIDGNALLGILRDQGFRRESTQMRARAVLRDLHADEAGVNWTYVAPRLARNAAAAVAGLQLTPRTGSAPDEDLRFLGDLWDGLDDLSEGVGHLAARLNSAIAYQMAGYQANAAVLAKAVEPLLSDRLGFSHLVVMLLRKQLVLLRESAPAFLKEPDVRGATTLETRLWEAATNALAAKGLVAATDYMLAGQAEGLAECSRLLEDAEQGYIGLGAVEEANLARSIRALLPTFEARSIWSHLGGAREANPVWARYLRLLARGLDRDVLHGASISELWPSQIAAVARGLFDDRRALVYRMPTSAGKTRIAELALVDELSRDEAALCLYVAPYRALAGEVKEKLQGLLSDLGFAISSLSGAYETDDFELAQAQHTSVLVVTPEKLDLLDRLSHETLERVTLVLLDESHIVGDLSRGPKYELLISRLRRRLQQAKFVSFSAVMSRQTLADFMTWLGGEQGDVVQENWRPSVQRVARFHWVGNRGFLEYVPETADDPLSQFVPGILEVREASYVHPATGRRRHASFPDRSSKAQVATALAVRLAEQGPVLVFCANRVSAAAVGNACQEWLELARLAGWEIPQYFAAVETSSAAVAEEWLGGDHPVTRGLRIGVAVHHAGIPHVVREAIERDVRERRLRIVSATSTLAQGVNLPIRNVVVHSCRRWTPSGGTQLIPARDYWNIAGRAGRAGEETEGTIIHLADTPQERRDFRYYISHREEVEPLEAALVRYLRDLVAERLAPLDLAEYLDEDLLALMVEEGVETADEVDRVVGLLEDSLTAIQAVDLQLPLDRLRDVFRSGARRILAAVDNPERRRVFSTTGLSTASCNALRTSIAERGTHVRDLLTDTAALPFDIASDCLEAVMRVAEMQPIHELGESQAAVLEQWMNGTPVSDLRREFGDSASTPEEFAAYVEDQFGYKLPWGASAYIRVAIDAVGITSEELSATARYLPTMIKYGVNNPEAARIMTAGVASRTVAMAMAADFAAQVEQPEGLTLLEWLYQIEVADLAEDYGLRSPLLEDTYRALSASQPNPRLRYQGPLSDQLPVTLSIRAARTVVGETAVRTLRLGDALVLARDYDSVIDRNAITLGAAAGIVGYLPRSLAQLIAPEIDTGRRFTAMVAAVDDNRSRFTARVELAN